ncbi:GH92 family glycosyl hydrolase [Fictibacillus enclensis]|uniref:GH92 family glycosyl hydrolase n=1 Tax=Fictibacillus enclensis TaxID=1017270 RepID=UPI0024BF6CBC|nr:GH92 family glycosyl hydrolase [Fictibacillus enclensis]WHY71608.1 GH92 family glycosyl hydrolase [Fictibacillus enclensis]
MIQLKRKAVAHVLLSSAIAVGMLNAPGLARVHAEPETKAVKDFFTSFENDQQKPTWENTVETDPNGNKMSSGIDGNIQYDGIQGDITNKVEEVRVSAENPPNEIGEKLIDRDVNTKWLAFEPTGWLQFKLSGPETVVKYAVTSANDYEGRDPKAWELQGSNDGKNWTVLDTRNDEDFPKRFERKLYTFDNDTPYLYYRLNITKNSGDGLTQVAEIALSNGIDVPKPPAADMKSEASSGPLTSYTAKTKAGWTGTKAFTYSGTHLEKGRAYSYNKVFDVNIKVNSKTQLSYFIHPEFTDSDQNDYSSTYASVDLAFSDGTYLHELGAVDQYGIPVTPEEQGKSKTLYVNQWNYKYSNIGAVAAGKTIKRILVAYDNPKGPGIFRGTVDDIKITGNPVQKNYNNLTDYVNILRGTQSNSTFSRGNNFPAIAVPHGFNFWTPATDAGSTSWLYSYNQSNNENNQPEIQAFSLSHEPSPWMGDRQTFQVMPSASEAEKPDADRKARALPFKHENETAKPHYYSVKFDNGIKAEIAPTDHAAMQRYTFKGDTSSLILDNVNNNGGISINKEKGEVTGYSDVKSGLSTGASRMYIYATFDQPIINSGKLTGEGRDNVTAYVRFDTKDQKAVTMKIATSLISIAQAKKNLEQEIQSDDTFQSIKEKAQQKWEKLLSKIEVEGASEDQHVTLYSNMYRLFLYPNSGFENTGTKDNPHYQYASPFSPPAGSSTPEATGAKIVDGKTYVNNGFWDTYRTAWPAYSFFTPNMAGEMIDGFVQQYRDGGWVSRWSSPGYANLMVGTSSDVAFADAYLKGVHNFDVKSFYQSAIKNASVVSPNAGTGRKGISQSIFDGYTNTSTGEGLSWSMDGYINDYGIANLAKALGKEAGKNASDRAQYKADAKYYMNRAQNYVHLFNPDTGFFMGRKANGEWRTSAQDFDARDWGGDYTETNAWNMAFHAPQDGQGLANLYGGKNGLADKLAEFFSTPETALHAGAYGGVIHEMREARDVRMGMYGHSNQPAHHITYMYNYAGQPWKTQEKVREVLERLYIGSEIGQGYAGDEDNGEMSAWQIFSALGFYPLKMGSPEYAIGAPLYKKATVHLENGKRIVVNAPKNSKKNKYIQGLKINGKSYSKTYLLHSDLADGARLDFDMGPKPSSWGTGKKDAPASITPSSTDGSRLAPHPMSDLTDHSGGKASDGDAGTLDALFDNTSSTRTTLNGENPIVQYNFNEAKRVQMYTLTSGADGSDGDLANWMLKGSADGRHWTILDRRTNEKFSWRLQTKVYSIKHPGKYNYYKLEFAGSTSTKLAEVELLGRDLAGDIHQLETSLRTFLQAGELKNPLKNDLIQNVKVAKVFEEKGQYRNAAAYMKKAIKQINAAAVGKEITRKAKKSLAADIHALLNSLQ